MQPITISLGGYQGPSSINTRAAAHFGEVLAQRLGDRVAFELKGDIHAFGRTSGELPAMVETGELSACYISTLRFAGWVPELKIFELPFVVRDRATVIGALEGPLGAHLRERMHEHSPFRVLGFWDNGFRHVTNKVRPIRSPAHCKGIRIRTQKSALIEEALAAMGFEPTGTDIKDFVDNIAGDRFDAQENPLTNIFHFNVQRYHRYITLTGHIFGASLFVCNAAQYRGWPPEVQEAVDNAGREASKRQRALAASEDEDILVRIDPRENELIRLTPDEHAAFRKAVEPVVARHRGDFDPQLFEYVG
ncbi:MAG: TRAP transporter substrate-binding protein [Burkholderiales bacterium]